MKSMLYIFLFVAILIPNWSQAQNKDIEKVKTLLQGQAAAWNKGDIEGFMQTYWKSDKLQFIGSSGITYGWQPTLERYKKAYPDQETMGQLRFEIIDAQKRSRKVISLVGKYFLKRSEEKGDAEGIFLLICKKVKGKWKIVVDQTCG